jgi:hypothetical protein
VFAELVGKDEQTSQPFKLAPSHVRFYRLAARHRRLAFLAHVGLGKTAHAVLLCAHRIGGNPATRILLVSASHGEAQKRCRLLLSILKSEAYREVFPTLQIERESDSQIIVKRPTLSKDPTFQSVGIGGEWLGARVDGIVLDDVATLEDQQSEATRIKKVEITRSMLLPRLAPGGWCLAIGTPWAINDVTDVLAQTPGFFCERVPVVDPVSGQPAFPEKFPPERIAALRAELGPFASARALDLYLVDDSTARIRRSWIDAALERGRDLTPCSYLAVRQPGWSVYVGLDLGISVSRGSDLTSFCTLAIGPQGDRQLLNVESGRWMIDGIISRILAHHKRYQPAAIIIETVAAQQFVKDLVTRLSDTPMIGFKTGQGRMSLPYQLEALATLFSNNKFLIPSAGGQLDPEIAQLCSELARYNPQSHVGDRAVGLALANWGAARNESHRAQTFRLDTLSR